MKRQQLPAEVEALWERPLPADEFERRLQESRADVESLAESEELIRWFSRRYPTARERMAYVRRKYAEWTRAGSRPPAQPRVEVTEEPRAGASAARAATSRSS